MADTPAERARRYRQHKQGDHTLCKPGCAARGDAAVSPPARRTPARGQQPSPAAVTPPKPPPRPPAPVAELVGDPAAERIPGGIEAMVQAFVDALPYREPDPRALLAQIAVRLAQRVDETGALPAAVRELRVLLVQLTEIPNQPPGPVDEFRLQRAQRRLDNLLAGI
jgi:hypothetical protein